LLSCLLFNENLARKFPRKSREIGRFLREFVSSNPVKFHFFSRELSEALETTVGVLLLLDGWVERANTEESSTQQGPPSNY